jgi:hypothetical protein
MSQENASFVADAQEWAEEQFGQVDLGDARLERRVVEIAGQMALLPGASLPQQMGNRADLVATYRLLNNPKVSHGALIESPCRVTLERAATESVVLLTQDVTHLDYSRYAKTMAGLAPIGDGHGQGLLLHTTLAVVPQRREVLGIANQQVFKRVPVPEGQYRRTRPKAERESRVWCEAIRDISRPPEGTRWVVVADRETDHTEFLLTCRDQGLDFNIRLSYASRVIVEGGQKRPLFAMARSWKPVAGKMVEIRGRGGRPARQAHVLISFGRVSSLRVPKKHEPFPIWVVRAWEIDAPPGIEPLEWVLATSVPVQTPTDALERVEWYTTRWLDEDFHQCLKTGCTIEQRDLEHADRVERLLGLLAPIAVRLLQLREGARLNPDAPATTVADPLMVSILAAKLGVSPTQMTVRAFWQGIAQLGGFQGRRGDGEPGWKTLWRGWLYLDAMAQGARIATSLPG